MPGRWAGGARGVRSRAGRRRAGLLPSVTGRKVLSLHRPRLLEGVLLFSESGLLSISSVVLGHHMLYSTLCQSR